jgi:acyl-CoA thioesterase II
MDLIFDQIIGMRNGDLGGTVDSSLDDLLRALELRPLVTDRFALGAPPSGATPGRVFGGQLLAQAVIGASATVAGKDIHSLHASFVRPGSPGGAVEVAVSRVRDGRSISTREVTVLENGEPLLIAIASFGTFRGEPDLPVARITAPVPADVPLLQEWAGAVPGGRHWIDQPPAVEMRLTESPSFMTGATATSARSHWMRLPRSVKDGHALNSALLAYASDFFLMDMVFRLHPDELGPGRANGFSLDHALWFHRPVCFEHWHLCTQEAVALVGDRGLARGAIHDADGRLVATVAQEVVLRLGGSS